MWELRLNVPRTLISTRLGPRNALKIANHDGTLGNRELIYDSQANQNYLKWPFIHQRAVSDFGMSVTVFAMQILKSYDYTTPRHKELCAHVAAGGFKFAPLTGRWIDGESDPVRDVAAAEGMLVGPENGPNIVFCVNGKNCATVFANGKFQFTSTSRFGAPMTEVAPLSLNSRWTDVVWHKIRAVPGLKLTTEFYT